MGTGVALFLAGLQLLGLGHLALQRHGVCWEHGTVTELGSSGLPVPRLAVAGALPGLHQDGTAVVLDGADGHHHCPVQASRRNFGAPPAGATLTLSVGEGGVALAASASGPRADALLLHRAPKQSPPATA
jgi:hypothetical protein